MAKQSEIERHFGLEEGDPRPWICECGARAKTEVSKATKIKKPPRGGEQLDVYFNSTCPKCKKKWSWFITYEAQDFGWGNPLW